MSDEIDVSKVYDAISDIKSDIAKINADVAATKACISAIKRGAEERKHTQDKLYTDLHLLIYGDSHTDGLKTEVSKIHDKQRTFMWWFKAIGAAILAEAAHIFHQLLGK